MKKWLLKLFLLCLAIMALWILFNLEMSKYLLQQAKGQVAIMLNTQKIESLKKQNYFNEYQLEKLELIAAVKKFTVDSMGFNPSKSYLKYYEQNKQPILWVVIACLPFELKAHSWKYPILGNMEYKGFFDHALAQKEATALQKQNLDVSIHEVSAWSTLGILNDPVLSSMLDRTNGSLANLIIHELTHANIFISEDATFNENVATFFGDIGATRFLKSTYGENSPHLKNYYNKLEDESIFAQYTFQKSKTLSEFYDEIKSLTEEEKFIAKSLFMQEFIEGVEHLPLNQPQKYLQYLSKKKLNNTFFISNNLYHQKTDSLANAFSEKHNNDFKSLYKALKTN